MQEHRISIIRQNLAVWIKKRQGKPGKLESNKRHFMRWDQAIPQLCIGFSYTRRSDNPLQKRSPI
jgi:hypothetical protein